MMLLSKRGSYLKMRFPPQVFSTDPVKGVPEVKTKRTNAGYDDPESQHVEHVGHRNPPVHKTREVSSPRARNRKAIRMRR